MNLLATAVPGLRDIRAPLVAGYLWLLVAWLVVEPERDLKDAGGLLASAVDLANTVGPVGTAIAVSMAAYFIGAFQQGLPQWIARMAGSARGFWSFSRSRIRAARGEDPHPPLPTDVERRRVMREQEARDFENPFRPIAIYAVRNVLPGWIHRRLFAKSDAEIPPVPSSRERVEELLVDARTGEDHHDLKRVRSTIMDLFPDHRTEDVAAARLKLEDLLPRMTNDQLLSLTEQLDKLREELFAEPSLPSTILLGENTALFGEADRLRAEGELRLTIAPPLVALVAVVAAETGWGLLLLLVAPYVLYKQGQTLQMQSRMLVGDAIRRGKVPSPSATRAIQIIDRLGGGGDASPRSDW